jgi:hypothetical protein
VLWEETEDFKEDSLMELTHEEGCFFVMDLGEEDLSPFFSLLPFFFLEADDGYSNQRRNFV